MKIKNEKSQSAMLAEYLKFSLDYDMLSECWHFRIRMPAVQYFDDLIAVPSYESTGPKPQELKVEVKVQPEWTIACALPVKDMNGNIYQIAEPIIGMNVPGKIMGDEDVLQKAHHFLYAEAKKYGKYWEDIETANYKKQQGAAAAKKWDGNVEHGSQLKNIMPGLRSLVIHPVVKTPSWPLEVVIISLNDQYGWSRGQIADWLETLDVDLSFNVPQEQTN